MSVSKIAHGLQELKINITKVSTYFCDINCTLRHALQTVLISTKPKEY